MTEQTVEAKALNPMVVRADEGEARWWFGGLAVIKTTAAETAGQLTIIEITEPPGIQAPLHVHHRDDEGFWILEGDVTFEVGDATIEATAGDYVFGPRGIPHRYTVGARGCGMLFGRVPGAREREVRATSEGAPSRPPPPPAEEEPTPQDSERLKAMVQEHGYALLV